MEQAWYSYGTRAVLVLYWYKFVLRGDINDYK